MQGGASEGPRTGLQAACTAGSPVLLHARGWLMAAAAVRSVGIREGGRAAVPLGCRRPAPVRTEKWWQWQPMIVLTWWQATRAESELVFASLYVEENNWHDTATTYTNPTPQNLTSLNTRHYSSVQKSRAHIVSNLTHKTRALVTRARRAAAPPRQRDARDRGQPRSHCSGPSARRQA